MNRVISVKFMSLRDFWLESLRVDIWQAPPSQKTSHRQPVHLIV